MNCNKGLSSIILVGRVFLVKMLLTIELHGIFYSVNCAYLYNLREIVGNTSHIKIIFILCIQFVLCMDCQFMKIKRICHQVQFFIISHGGFQHLTKFLKIPKSLILS